MDTNKLPTPPVGYEWEVEPFSEFICSLTLGPEDQSLLFSDEMTFYQTRYFWTDKGLYKAAERLLKAYDKHEAKVDQIRQWRRLL